MKVNFLKKKNNEILSPCLEKEYAGEIGSIAYIGLSAQGYLHERYNIKCQDRSGVKIIGNNNKYVAAAIADGIGSSLLSDIGAEIAIDSALKYLEYRFDEMDNPLDNEIIEVLKLAMKEAFSNVSLCAYNNNRNIDDYDSTLTITVYNGKDLYIAHIGDDGVIVLNNAGCIGMVTTCHKGEFANSVFPLQEEVYWEFLIVRDVVEIILATDGVLNQIVNRTKEQKSINLPLNELRMLFKKYSSKTLLRNTKNFLTSSKIKKIIYDDITIVIIVNKQNT